MFYSICTEDEWDVDCWDSRGHYTKGGECHSPANAVYFAHSIAERIFADIRVKYTDEGVKRFIQEACDADKVRVDSDEIDAFCKAVRQTYEAETVEEAVKETVAEAKAEVVKVADVNGDGKVNTADAVEAVKKVAKKRGPKKKAK